jgi:hypothetical protein
VGIVLAALQFFVIPFLYLVQMDTGTEGGNEARLPFLIVLVVMGGYIFSMRRVASISRRRLVVLDRKFSE